MGTRIYIIVILVFFCSCSARRLKHEMGDYQKDPRMEEGRLVFKKNCQKCHPGGESGVGPEINNIRVPKALIKFRVRSRAFLLWTGRMPQFDHKEISAKELKSLVIYIKAMQKNK